LDQGARKGLPWPEPWSPVRFSGWGCRKGPGLVANASPQCDYLSSFGEIGYLSRARALTANLVRAGSKKRPQFSLGAFHFFWVSGLGRGHRFVFSDGG
jgi:hypothetical protein